MLKDSLPALIISCILYLLLSLWYPLDYTNSYLPDTIHFVFNIHWTLWIPVLIIIGLLPTKLSIRWPIGISALAATNPRNYPSKLYSNGYVTIYRIGVPSAKL